MATCFLPDQPNPTSTGSAIAARNLFLAHVLMTQPVYRDLDILVIERFSVGGQNGWLITFS